MKHEDIYKKFMIEYDKALIASSYPSLTNYEIATTLDKAYLALIAQKLTGNNPRQVPFEGDIKSIEDIRPLIFTSLIDTAQKSKYVSNEIIYSIPTSINFLYYLKGGIKEKEKTISIDNQDHSYNSVTLISHEDAENFKNTPNNLPWIKDPVCYLDSTGIHVLLDSYSNNITTNKLFELTYIKKPKLFVSDFENNGDIETSNVIFELNDSMAEELINLAIILSAEIVESQRTQTKVQLRPLES